MYVTLDKLNYTKFILILKIYKIPSFQKYTMSSLI